MARRRRTLAKEIERFSCELISNVTDMDVSKLNRISDSPELDINFRNDKDETVLHVAANEGRADVVALLLSRRQDIDVNAKADGKTPLMRSIIRGHYDVLEVLLLQRADYIQVNGEPGSRQWSPLHLAAIERFA